MLKNIFKSIKKFSKTGDKQTVSWGPIVAIGSTIAIYFAAQAIAVIILTYYGDLHHWDTQRINDWLNGSINAQFAYSVMAEGLGLVILFVILKKYKTSFKAIGVKKPRFRDIYYVIGGFLVYFTSLYIATELVKKVYHNLNLNQQQAVGFQSASGTGLVLVAISLVIFPAIVEELLFRGFLFSGLKKVFPVIWAGLFTSILFAIPHLFESASGGLLWVAGIDTFILSTVLVYLREKTGTIWASIGLHALKNSLAFLALFVFRVS
jgi:membrane protease YdiL (CAAX protease family)